MDETKTGSVKIVCAKPRGQRDTSRNVCVHTDRDCADGYETGIASVYTDDAEMTKENFPW